MEPWCGRFMCACVRVLSVGWVAVEKKNGHFENGGPLCISCWVTAWRVSARPDGGPHPATGGTRDGEGNTKRVAWMVGLAGRGWAGVLLPDEAETG